MGPSEHEVSAAISKAFQLPSVKPEQLQVVVSALKRQDVFTILPTGEGAAVAITMLSRVESKIHLRQNIIRTRG